MANESDLRMERKTLVRRTHELGAELEAARERSFRSGCGFDARTMAAHKALDEALSACKAFDLDHPEILAAIREEKARKAEAANIWN